MWRQSRAICRSIVFLRENSRCQRCGVFVSDDVPEWADNRAHVHERLPRSLGGDPLNPDECLTVVQALSRRKREPSS